MRRLFILLTAIFAFLTSSAQITNSIVLDRSTFRAVQTDALTGVNIDPIGVDRSRRQCARLKIFFHRMTREQMAQLEPVFPSGTIDYTKCKVADGNTVLILEFTARPQVKFYLKHPTFGTSNEVTFDYEGNKEYQMEASLNQTFSIVVNSNVAGADVYLDGAFQGKTDATKSLTVKDVMIGNHRLKLVYGSVTAQQQIDVNSSKISFRQNLDIDEERFAVTFRVLPATATIVVDNNGLELPINNGEISLKLAKGMHTYEIKAKDYRTAHSDFEVTATTASLNISLTPAFGWLEVSAAALAGAEVLIDGKRVGTAPFKSGNLASGRYTVRVNKSLYKSFEGTVTISDNQTTQFNPTLVANFANVTLTAPDNAEIWVDGRKMGIGKWSGPLLTGSYTFEARKQNHRTTVLTRQIGLEPSTQSYTLSAPTPVYGSLIVNSSPVANVIVDGKVLGKSPVKLNNILIGQHTVTVKNSEFDAQTSSVTISEGQTTTLDIKLSSIPKNQIHYTTTDGEALWPLCEGVHIFGAEIVSNTYKNGKGVIAFNGAVTMIGPSAFKGCIRLKSFVIPDGVISISGRAFNDCKNLTSVKIGCSVKSIGNNAFSGCEKLKSITIPYSVTTIGSSAFEDCYSLTNIVIPDSVTLIGESAFARCRSLISASIGDGVKKIESYTFVGCRSLTSVTIPNSVTSIGNYAFWQCENIVKVTIPNSVTSIGSKAFEACYSLTNIVIPGSVILIGESAFASCRSLISARIGYGVKGIESHTFSECRSLTSVTIPKSVTFIGTGSFSGCQSLTNIYCHAVTPPTLGSYYIFNECPKKPKIYVPASSVKAYKKSSRWKDSGGKIVSM